MGSWIVAIISFGGQVTTQKVRMSSPVAGFRQLSQIAGEPERLAGLHGDCVGLLVLAHAEDVLPLEEPVGRYEVAPAGVRFLEHAIGAFASRVDRRRLAGPLLLDPARDQAPSGTEEGGAEGIRVTRRE